MIDDPAWHRGGCGPRDGEEGAGVGRRASSPSACPSSRAPGRMTPVAAQWTITSSAPSAATSSTMRSDDDVGADQDRLGAERSQLLGRLLCSPVAPEVPDRDPLRSEPCEAERDRLADPPRPAGHEDRGALEAHSRRGSGSYAGAEDGIVSHPMRERGSRVPSSAFEDACPSRSSSSIFSSPYRRTGWSSAAGPRSARGRARGAGTRSAASRARRGCRCRRESARPLRREA